MIYRTLSIPKSQTLKPSTLNPKPETLNPNFRSANNPGSQVSDDGADDVRLPVSLAMWGG